MNLVKAQELAKELSITDLRNYANGSNPEMMPPYIALGALQAKEIAEKKMQSMQGGTQGEQPSVKEQLEQKAGLMALQGQQQQQAQQQMQDPIVQMQMQELQIKMEDLKLKQQKQALDAAAKADQIRVEESRIAAQKEIAAMQVSATAAANKDRLSKQMELDGARLGVDVAKHRAQLAAQQRAAQKQPNNPKKERN